MSKFQDAMRRVITGDDRQGESVIIIDGGPSSTKGNPDLGEMFEIWEDAAWGAFDSESEPRSGRGPPRARAAKGQFPSALVRNPSSTG